MAETEGNNSEIVHGSATGAPIWVQESARGSSPKNFVAEPKVGPGPSGGSDASESSSRE